MRAILGIDAAWTPDGSSGIALVTEQAAGNWSCVAVAPSYGGFLVVAGMPTPENFADLPSALVNAAKKFLGGAELVLVAADIPLAKSAITKRRAADDLVSRKFGAAGCSTHSPTANRPGPISATLRDGFAANGFSLAVSNPIALPAIVETYPHPALLTLMGVERRVPYKISKASRLWRDIPPSDRWLKAVGQLSSIAGELDRVIKGSQFIWPTTQVSMASLKPLEDQIDALVCAWVGIQILNGAAEPLGNEDAAVWVPQRH
ncbi:MAG TPA: DUF429 domain-containing protein [Rhodospirillaceae bacterium]|nr:DUF429 domain-containing protein [Rhodospirillaceae bacterium]